MSPSRVLAILVAAGRPGASAEQIAEDLWGESQPSSWRPTVRMGVTRLRRQLPDGWDIVSQSGVYQLDPGPDGQVDAWLLSELASNDAAVAESDLPWLLRGTPFGSVDLVGLVASNTEHLRLLQVAVAERFCKSQPTSLSVDACTALSSLLREHPFNESLALRVATALAGANRRSEAHESLEVFAATYLEHFDALAPEIATMLAEADIAGDGLIGPAGASDEEGPPRQRTAAVELPVELRNLATTSPLGRENELELLRGSNRSLLLGPEGSGRSRLLASLIAQDPESATIYLAGDDRHDLPLAPFVVALPEIRDELLAAAAPSDSESSGFDRDSAQRAAPTVLVKILTEHLEALATQRPQRIVVDDANLLDAMSLSVLRLLVRSSISSAIRVVVCGRSDDDDGQWVDFCQGAQRAGVCLVELAPLQLEHIEQLVYEQFPTATMQQRHGLAVEVLDASRGLPAVATVLVAAADPASLAIPQTLGNESTFSLLTARLSSPASCAAAAAAVLGTEFSVGSLISLLDAAEHGIDERVAFGALDELLTARVIEETVDADRLRFKHLLIQKSILDTVPMFRQATLHYHAIGLADGPHSRARHLYGAGRLADKTEAVEAVVESARTYARRGKRRSAAHQFELANRIAGWSLDVSSLSDWASALDRSGADGSAQRSAAFEVATKEQDWDAALSAALAGLPEAERPDGDPARVAMLEHIPIDQLRPSARFVLMEQLSRQQSLSGDPTAALGVAQRALDAAKTADEIALGHIALWTATRPVEPHAVQLPGSVLESGGSGVRVRLAQMAAIGAIERGDYSLGTSEAERFASLARSLGDPLRIWQSQVLQAMVTFDEGKFSLAETMAQRSAAYADLHALRQGPAIRVGQLGYAQWLRGQLGEFWPALEPYSADMAQSSYGRSLLVLSQVSAGVADPDPAPVIAELVASALERPRSPSLVVQAFLSSLLTEYAPSWADESRRFIARFGDKPIVAGFGIGDLGPAVRYVANLTPDRGDRLELREQAVQAADRHGIRLWRVLTRLDLVEDEGAGQVPRVVDDARELAQGSDDLEAVVERRTSLAHERNR